MLTSALASLGTSARWLPSGKHHVHLAADAFDQAAHLGQVAGHVEHAVARTDDVDARLVARPCARVAGTFFGPYSVHSQAIARLAHCHWSSSMVRGRKRTRLVPSGVTPPPIISAIDPVTTTAGQIGVQHRVGALHRAFGAFTAELFFGQAGDHDGQLMRRQRVGVVQHAGDRQVLATHRAVDHDLQALDRGEDVDSAPVAAGPIVIEDEHQTISSALRFLLRACRPGASAQRGTQGASPACPARRRTCRPGRRIAEEARPSHRSGPCCRCAAFTTCASAPAPAGPINGRAEIRLVK